MSLARGPHDSKGTRSRGKPCKAEERVAFVYLTTSSLTFCEHCLQQYGDKAKQASTRLRRSVLEKK